MEAKELRDTVIKVLKTDKTVVVAELDGNYFSGADIAVVESGEKPKVFRLTVIEHNQQKSFI